MLICADGQMPNDCHRNVLTYHASPNTGRSVELGFYRFGRIGLRSWDFRVILATLQEHIKILIINGLGAIWSYNKYGSLLL